MAKPRSPSTPAAAGWCGWSPVASIGAFGRDPEHRDRLAPRVPLPRCRPPAQRAIAELVRVSPVVGALGAHFAEAGHEISLVGGSVRDALLGRLGQRSRLRDVGAPRRRSSGCSTGHVDAMWDIGKAFGTIGCRIGQLTCEITTYRTEQYDAESRKPARRVRHLAGRRPRPPGLHGQRDGGRASRARRFVDPFDGVDDLASGMLRTPGRPEDSFDDDPLRMLRAARFAAQLGFDGRALGARGDDRDGRPAGHRVGRAGPGRVHQAGALAQPTRRPAHPGRHRLADQFIPELPALQLEIDEHHRHKDVYEHTLTVVEQAIDLEQDGPDLTLRLAALLHDIGKPATRRFEAGGGVSFHHHEMVGARMTRKRLKALRYPKDLVDDVARLVELHLRFHGYADGEWTDSAVRRYVRDAGPSAGAAARTHPRRLHDAQPTQGGGAGRRLHHLEERIAALAEAEELAAIRPDLDGNDIMEILGIPPGRAVGEAYQYLLELRLDRGPLDAGRGDRGCFASGGTPVSERDAAPRRPPGHDGEHEVARRRRPRPSQTPASMLIGSSATTTAAPSTKATLKTMS